MKSELDMKASADVSADKRGASKQRGPTIQKGGPSQTLGNLNRSEFIAFCEAATCNKASPEFEVLYQFLLGCFKQADQDCDGKVDAEEFDALVELAARDVRRLGLAPTHKQSYGSAAERRTARTQLFQAMDADNSGFIGFEEWLQYAVKHIEEKVRSKRQGMQSSIYGSKEEFLRFTKAMTQSRASAEYKEFYKFLLTCFVEADQDRDGKVNLQEFDQMVERAGAFPRAHGLAPSTAEMFPSEEARKAARKKHFDAMDADRSGFVGFEEWLEFTYDHVCAKMAQLAEQQATATGGSCPYGLDRELRSSGQQRGIVQQAAPAPSVGILRRLLGWLPFSACRGGAASSRSATPAFTAEVAPLEGGFTTAHMTLAQFIAFCRAATSDPSSPEYKQLYGLLLQYFTAADGDCDGLVDAEEFDMLVELAARDVRRLGLAPTHKQTYKSVKERRAARAKLFKEMDADSSGSIGFEEWLQYAMTHIAEKVKAVPAGKAFSLHGSKQEFVGFVRAMAASRSSAEYKEFYSFLLDVFTDADKDQDGKVDFAEFEVMVEAAGAIPRLYGFAPVSTEMYPTKEARISARQKYFKDMGADRAGFVRFEQWLEFTYNHVCKKVEQLDQNRVSDSKGESALGNMSRNEFISFCRAATTDKASPEYEKLYQFLLTCFTSADSDYDGLVDAEEFDMMVELAAKDVRRLGLAPTHKQTYKTISERRAARAELFKTMDSDGSGTINFEEWLEYALGHIAAKVQAAEPGEQPSLFGNKEEFLRFCEALTQGKEGAAYKQLYRVLLDCFSQADADRDGKVNFAEFYSMVDKAAAFPRAHGFAPMAADLFKNDASALEAFRRDLFNRMDADKSGTIGFEEWLDFTYDHICEKVEGLRQAGVLKPQHAEVRPPTSGETLAKMSRREFIAFCRSAVSDKQSAQHRLLHSFLVECFKTADCDYDGKVDAEEFDMLVELAAKDVRRLGLAPTHKQSYKSADDRRSARAKLFSEMDTDRSGHIGLEEWVAYALSHIAGKVGKAPSAGPFRMLAGKKEFLRFCAALAESRSSAEYKEFYTLLLRCFEDADQDMDGKVNLLEFDKMVEQAGALPRMYGLAPSSAELYKSSEERIAGRKRHFDAMDKDRSGFISFEEFLEFTYAHVCGKVALSSSEAAVDQAIPLDATMGSMSRSDFVQFCKVATTERSSPQFEMLYQFLLECFIKADNDFDGKVDAEEFDMMVDLAAVHVRRLGLAPTHKQTYPSVESRRAVRAQLFRTIDTDRSGLIGFEEWLEYSLGHIAEKVRSAVGTNPHSMHGNKQEFINFVQMLSKGKDSAEYKEFYSFLWECFEEADQDRDGKVNLEEFDAMVEKAGAFPRAHGLAPRTSELYRTKAARIEGRKLHFQAMDADKSGYISFEEWLEFTYEHVCQKARSLPK